MSTVVVEPSAAEGQHLSQALGAATLVVPSLDHARRSLEQSSDIDAVVVGPTIDKDAALAFAETYRLSRPSVGIILVRRRVESSLLKEAIRAGIREVVAERDLADIVDAARHAHQLAIKLRAASGDTTAVDSGGTRATIVTVFAAKGGCGKTTMATNLAAALAEGG